MLNLKKLAEYNGYVWIRCSTEEQSSAFLAKAERYGFTTPNGDKPTDLMPYPLYGITDDMCVGYVSGTIAGLAEKYGRNKTPQIDYGNFLKGRRDCILVNPYREFEDFYKWNALVAPFMSNKERREFDKLCDHRTDELSLMEYRTHIHRYLILSPWHYTPDQALERMTWDDSDEYIAECFEKGMPVSSCAVELGFGCG